MKTLIQTIEMHTGGEPLRIVTGGVPEIPGKTILQKRKYFREHYDHIRTALMSEPRGHADMYGAVITDPVSPAADLGVIFMHNEGYSTMCGHAVIALAKWAIESGRVKGDKVIIDVPSGTIEAWGVVEEGIVQRSLFRNVPSFAFLTGQEIFLEEYGTVKYDIAFGGAFYAIMEAGQVGLALDVSSAKKIVEAGMSIKKAIMNKVKITHPVEPDLGFLYGVIFTAPPENPEHHSRNACVFADGQLDRSATGSGVSARAALLHQRNELKKGKQIEIESILGTTMTVEIAGITSVGRHEAVVPEVSGSSYYTGQAEFIIDPSDPLRQGFLL